MNRRRGRKVWQMKFKAVLFAVVLAIAMAVPASAASGAGFTLAPEFGTAKTGDEIRVVLRYDTGAALASLTMNLQVNENFAILDIQAGDIPAGDLSYNAVEGYISVLYLDAQGGGNPAQPGTGMLVLRLQALTQTGTAVAPVTVADISCAGVNPSGEVEAYEASVSVGTVHVNNGEAVSPSPPRQIIVVEGASESPESYPSQPMPGAGFGTDADGSGSLPPTGSMAPGGQNQTGPAASGSSAAVDGENTRDGAGPFGITGVVLAGAALVVVCGAAYLVYRRKKALPATRADESEDTDKPEGGNKSKDD